MLTDSVLTALSEALARATGGPFGNEDADNPHLITCGRDKEGAFLYFEEALYADDPDGQLYILLRNNADSLLQAAREAARLRDELETLSNRVGAYMLLVTGIRAGPLETGEHAVVLKDLIDAHRAACTALGSER